MIKITTDIQHKIFTDTIEKHTFATRTNMNNTTEKAGYQASEIEKKWQQKWKETNCYRAANPGEKGAEKQPYYILDMFPYPSGAGLHVGHPLGYIASDIIARYKRHQGFNVLHPMGYDSFGLPAEQYAIQTGRHPADTTLENTQRYREQLDRLGFSFDWSREVKTSDPSYYKWTQWIFIQLFKSWYNPENQKAEPIETLIAYFEQKGSEGIVFENNTVFTAEEWRQKTNAQKEDILMQFRLAFLSMAYVNWCPALGTVLANDEVKDGFSERGGHPVERKKMKQWSLRITAYAERLLEGLETLNWTDNIKEIQRNWIGKSRGASLCFPIENNPDKQIEVFTTRPDTLFGVSYLTLAPEHEYVLSLCTIQQEAEVKAYLEYVSTRSERDRQSEVKKITGVFTGSYALHPFTEERIPIWIGEYVLGNYGTGAVMAVPAHDERDYDFAKHFGLKIIQVIQAPEEHDFEQAAWTEKKGILQNSSFLDGMDVSSAIQHAIEVIEKSGKGRGKTNYRLRDAAFGRQRYWGEPIPIYYKEGIAHVLEEKHLPLTLPQIDSFLPTSEGEPPLARATSWNYDPLHGVIENGKGYPIETTTMPGWAGSSWYFFRYMDPNNPHQIVSKEAQSYWKNVQFYVGGAEHATGHLLYARFWTQFLYDLGYVNQAEPFQHLMNQGMIQGESALIYRVKNENKLISAEYKKDYDCSPLNIDIQIVNNRKVDLQALITWRNEYKEYDIIQGENGFQCDRVAEKMSKSKWNVVNPDDICNQYGADTLRMYEMFLGPIQDAKPWSTQGIEGVYKFLKKTWRLVSSEEENYELSREVATDKERKILHKTIKKITADLEELSFNTSISAFMICVNELQDLKCNKREIIEPLLILLSPFAPHFAEELWAHIGNNESIQFQNWPQYHEAYLTESEINYPVSINGKTRTQMLIPSNATAEQVKQLVLQDEIILKWTEGKELKKFIFVPNKIVNIVV